MNRFKTAIFMTLLTVIFLWIGKMLGGQNGMIMALIMALGMNFFSYWFSDKIVLRMYGAKEVSEAEAPNLYQIVRRIASRAGIPMPKVYIMQNPAPNAFATGRNPQHAAVAVTTGILQLLDSDELEGVIGHEIAHINNRDILISTIAATFAAAIMFLADMARWSMIFGGARHDDDEGGSPISAIGAIAAIIIAPIAATLIQLAISRSREYIADETGAKYCGNPLSLARALKKLAYGVEAVPMDAKPATAHMFIVNPLSGSSILQLFSTHPPIEKRIERLEQMAYGR